MVYGFRRIQYIVYDIRIQFQYMVYGIRIQKDSVYGK